MSTPPLVGRIRLVLVEADPAGLGDESDCYFEEALRICGRQQELAGPEDCARIAHEEVSRVFGELAGDPCEYVDFGPLLWTHLRPQRTG